MRQSDCMKFRRGQVWFIEEPEEITEAKKSSHIQAKSRPWLIVSTDRSNKYAYIFNVLPISSKTQKDFIAHVKFNADRNWENVVECEQITTKSIEDFIERGRYMYTLTDDVMQVVSTKLANQLELSLQLPNMDYIVRVIERLAEAKAAAAKNSYQEALDDAVLELGIKLEKLFDISTKDITPIPNASLEALEEKKKESLDLSVTKGIIPEKKPVQKKQRKNASYSREYKKQFLEDCEKLSLAEMAKKYNATKNDISRLKYYFKKSLDK